MNDDGKSKEELIAELRIRRRQLADLESWAVDHKQAESTLQKEARASPGRGTTFILTFPLPAGD